MARLIKEVAGRYVVEFDRGTFDDWCVWVRDRRGRRTAPKDERYFTILQRLGRKHGAERLYADFVRIFDLTTKEIDPKVADLITEISLQYGEDSLKMDTWLTVIYGGMIAEENKEGAILKRRIKRLGMHQILMEGMPPREAANFSKGMKWKELDSLCKAKGF